MGGFVVENFFSGSFLGALLFGYPYQSVGTVDIIAIALLVLLLARASPFHKKRNRDASERGVDRQAEASSRSDDKLREAWLGKRDQPEGRRSSAPQTKAADEPFPNPQDNIWSRRLRSDSGYSRDEDGEQAPLSSRPDKGRERGHPSASAKERAAAMWQHLSSEPERESTQASDVAVAPGVLVPSGFDVGDFLEGARALYVRLQTSWAARQINDLAPFTSEDLFALLKKQAEKDPIPVPVDIILINAMLQDVVTMHGDEQATVLFQVTMRSGNAEHPEEINEIWLFVRGEDTGGMWRLTGISSVA